MIGIDPTLLPEYWIGEDLNFKMCQFIRSPDGNEYLMMGED